MATSPLVALVVGILQGVLEWLPVSSEGNVTVVLVALGASPAAAVRLALVLHAGTAVAAAAYYRGEIAGLLAGVGDWRPADPFGDGSAELSFLAVATVVSGAVGVAAYLVLDAVATALSGGLLVVAIGVALVATGLLQRSAEGNPHSASPAGVSLDGAPAAEAAAPGPVDALLVGTLQGLAVLPGVSRSGTTVPALLLRGHPAPRALRLSFLLSIPAAAGAAGVVVLEAGGIPTLSPAAGLVALASAAVVGYLTIDALVRVVRAVAFWAVCVGLGVLAVVGGLAVAVG